MRGILVAAMVASLAACSQQTGGGASAPLPADEALRQLIVGPWSPAKDSDDYGQAEEDIFAADGTYIVNSYKDATCRILVDSGKFKWSIENGILATSAADSTDAPSKDQILILDDKRLKTRSMETQEIYSRNKGYLCTTRATGKIEDGAHQTDSKEPKAPPPVNPKPKSHFWHG